MYWHQVLRSFNGLVREMTGGGGMSKYKLADLLGHDKKTVAGWVKNASPAYPHHVGEVIGLALQSGIEVGRFQTFEPIYDFSPSLTYESKLSAAPPDFGWLTGSKFAPPVVRQNFLGLPLDSPLGVSSSPLLADDRWTKLMLDLGYGLCTFKTRRTGPKDSWGAPQIAFVANPPDLSDYDPANPPDVVVEFDISKVRDWIKNVVNSLGVPSETTSQWQEVYERIKHHPKWKQVGLSVMGDFGPQRGVAEDFEFGVERAKELNPPFVELNPSCPNLEKKGDVCDDPVLLAEICERSKKALRGTPTFLAIKLPYLPYDKLREVVRAVGPHVDAITMRNSVRVRAKAVDREGNLYTAFPGREFAGLSGPCTFEISRRAVKDLLRVKSELGLDFSTIAVGGVSTPSDVYELLNVGADVVQACTAPMFDPLLGWKVRFHGKRVGHTLPKARQALSLAPEEEAEMLMPRDELETESLKNALKALKEIKERDPAHPVLADLFIAKWNGWMRNRPTVMVGQARRVSGARSVTQWIREFLG